MARSKSERLHKLLILTADKDSIRLRFKVGDRVLALHGGENQKGTVVALFFTQESFPPDRCAPYQIRLDRDAKLIYAAVDCDAAVWLQSGDNARATAMAMALHPRLGQASPARFLSSDLTGHIIDMMRALNTNWLVCIMVRSGLYIDRIRLCGTTADDTLCGQLGGVAQERFVLQPGEYITKVTGRAGDALDCIQFHTSCGRSSRRYGNESGGTAFAETAPAGQCLVGLRMSESPHGYLEGEQFRGKSAIWGAAPSVSMAALAAAHLERKYDDVCAHATTAQEEDDEDALEGEYDDEEGYDFCEGYDSYDEYGEEFSDSYDEYRDDYDPFGNYMHGGHPW